MNSDKKKLFLSLFTSIRHKWMNKKNTIQVTKKSIEEKENINENMLFVQKKP